MPASLQTRAHTPWTIYPASVPFFSSSFFCCLSSARHLRRPSELRMPPQRRLDLPSVQQQQQVEMRRPPSSESRWNTGKRGENQRGMKPTNPESSCYMRRFNVKHHKVINHLYTKSQSAWIILPSHACASTPGATSFLHTWILGHPSPNQGLLRYQSKRLKCQNVEWIHHLVIIYIFPRFRPMKLSSMSPKLRLEFNMIFKGRGI